MSAGPRLLLVEDDEVSASFLAQALAALPARVDVAGSIQQARELAFDHPYDLWIIDAHLPDGSGLDCRMALFKLRERVPALAVTAGASSSELDALCGGGFLEVLMKPVSIAPLLASVRRVLAMQTTEEMQAAHEEFFAPLTGKQPVWEQERSLAAIGGNPVSLATLRGLFLAELPTQRIELALAQASGDAGVVKDLLHKLRAACGFVGAARLAQAVEAMSEAPLDAAALRSFEFAAEDTLSTQP